MCHSASLSVLEDIAVGLFLAALPLTLGLTDITGNGIRWARLQDSGATVAFGNDE